jgi:hypothetical protein
VKNKKAPDIPGPFPFFAYPCCDYFRRFRLLAAAPIPTTPEPRSNRVPGSGKGGLWPETGQT